VERFAKEFSDVPVKPIPKLLTGKMAADMFDIRMMASALDDADFIETEAHFAGNSNMLRRYRPDGASLNLDMALSAVMAVIHRKETKNKTVGDVRNKLFTSCLSAGNKATGIFTLTAPTGSGKTLSMLAFALRHARKNGLRRIVLVMPFLNIIDQTAKVYQEIFSTENGFPENYVLEDHSLAGFKSIDDDYDLEDNVRRTRKMLVENWDAPIILTTSVKFFESLHSCRNSQLRKLHRLSKSVILFDEAQSLPPELAVLSLATLSRLAEPNGLYGASVVFSTATQPAFETISPMIEQYSRCGWTPKSLIKEESVKHLFDKMSGRVSVIWREQEHIELEHLADELVGNGKMQSLCILNLKRHARKLSELLAERLDSDTIFHLSTTMCSSHRKNVLSEVLKRLDDDTSVVLVSTQCVEAGVDISFPIVYRALAPLESIAQAAGRCNRHGGETGKVIVFTPKDDNGFFPPGYGEGISVTKALLAECRAKGNNPDELNLLNSSDFIRHYYKLFFTLGKYDASRSSQYELFEAVDAGRFDIVSKKYKLIPGDMVNVLVSYDKGEFDRLRQVVQKRDYMTADEIRQWVAQAREHSVGIFRPKHDSPKWQALDPVQFGAVLNYGNQDANWFICLPEAEYDPLCGLKLPENFVVFC
jgi:CRISPR-associated helicase Cas3